MSSSRSLLANVVDDLFSKLDSLENSQKCFSYVASVAETYPNKLERNALFPNITEYLAGDPLEVEIQSFNIYRKIPDRINSDDALASWMLETDTLNRLTVAVYLASQTSNKGGAITSNGVLDQIALSICSLDVGQRFVDGLKLFLPTTGALLLGSNFEGAHSIRMHLLGAYARAHLQVSQSPILPIGIENWEAVAEIASCIIDLNDSIGKGQSALSVCMNEFFGAVKASTSRETSISIRLLTELFNDTISGTPLAPLPLPHEIPQYLFASCRYASSACMKLTVSERENITFNGWMVLMRNSIYLFRNRFFIDTLANSFQSEMFSGEFLENAVSDSAGFLLCIPLSSTAIDIETRSAYPDSEESLIVVSSVFSALAVFVHEQPWLMQSDPLNFLYHPSYASWFFKHVIAAEISLSANSSAQSLLHLKDELEAAVWSS